jgi:hypothetical protein
MSKNWHDSLGFGSLHGQAQDLALAINSRQNNHSYEQL